MVLLVGARWNQTRYTYTFVYPAYFYESFMRANATSAAKFSDIQPAEQANGPERKASRHTAEHRTKTWTAWKVWCIWRAWVDLLSVWERAHTIYVSYVTRDNYWGTINPTKYNILCNIRSKSYEVDVSCRKVWEGTSHFTFKWTRYISFFTF